MRRLLIAASLLSASAFVQAANWVPSSPLIQVGNDCAIFFDSSASLDVTDNLYSSPVGTSATTWTVTPGFLLEYGKDAQLSATISAKRAFVNYSESALRGLNDDRNSLSGSLRFAPGGPLSLSLDSSYRVTARNDDLQMQGLGGILGATLFRQANYAHSFHANYKLGEKFSVGIGYSNSYNNYTNPTVTVTGTAPDRVYNYNTNSLTELNTKSIPLSFDYLATDKLSFGLAYQHDTTDYSAAPYYNRNENGAASAPRPALQYKQLVKDFVGLTTKGQLTESGKLNGNIRIGYSQFHYDSLANQSDLSYAISLSYAQTDLVSHSLTLSRDVTASSTNSQMDTKSYIYGISYAPSEFVKLNLSVTKSDVRVTTSLVNTYVYSLGADYQYSNYLSFQAGYSRNDASGSLATSNYASNTFTLSAAFRY